MSTLEQIGLIAKADGLEFATSHFDTMHAIYNNCEPEDELYAIAVRYERSIDQIPQMLPESSPRYDERERLICETADALEADFITALEAHFLGGEA